MLMATKPHRAPAPRSRFCDVLVRVAVRRIGAAEEDDTPQGRLRLLCGIREAAEDAIRQQVLLSRVVYGMSWSDIGQALGVSAQAAHRKYKEPPAPAPAPAGPNASSDVRSTSGPSPTADNR
jgi:hypothetical protein